MAVAFDESWEYYSPDPEVDEVVHNHTEVTTRDCYSLPCQWDDKAPSPVFNTTKHKPSDGGPTGWLFKKLRGEFTRMWLEGVTTVEIQRKLGVNHLTLRKWRDWLALPKRKMGYYPREVQIEHMQAQIRKMYTEYRMDPIREIFRSHAVFDAQGRHVNGTDKQSNHNYGDAYDALFTDRGGVNLMMEVGVADGACLRAWREVFPNALIVGMDIHPSAQARGDRIQFFIGDQRSQEDCECAAGGRQFDVIIEDATHVLENTLLTFLFLWPFVKPGGLYIVEEWAGIGSMRANIKAMWPFAEIIDTAGPFGGNEPLVVFRKPAKGG